MQHPRPHSARTTHRLPTIIHGVAVAGATMLLGCGGAATPAEDFLLGESNSASVLDDPAPVGAFTSPSGGFTVSMPIPVKEQLTWEGPVKMVLAASRRAESQYEVAYFDLPATLDSNEQASLVERVIEGLSNASGVRVRALETTYTEDEPSTELAMEIRPSRRGTWRLFFVDGQRLFQLSVLSVTEDGHDLRAAEFFDSFHLDHRPNDADGLMTARASSTRQAF